MKKSFAVAAALASMVLASHAGKIIDESFDGASLDGTVWNRNWGNDLATLDTDAENVLFTHTSGFTQFGNNSESTPALISSTVGHAKFTVGALIGTVNFHIGGAGNFADNKSPVVKLTIASAGTYELFWSNNASGDALAFDNGAGWTGTIAPGSFIYRVDGGKNQFGGAGNKGWGTALADDTKADSFGFWANEACSCTIDDVIIHDSLTLAP